MSLIIETKFADKEKVPFCGMHVENAAHGTNSTIF
jgi:hypothetical protein